MEMLSRSGHRAAIAEIGSLHGLVVAQRIGRALADDMAVLEEIAAVGDLQASLGGASLLPKSLSPSAFLL